MRLPNIKVATKGLNDCYGVKRNVTTRNDKFQEVKSNKDLKIVQNYMKW